MDDLENLKRRISKFQNIGRRNKGVSEEFGGAVYDKRDLVKPLKPQKEGAKKTDDKKWKTAQRKAGVIPSA